MDAYLGEIRMISFGYVPKYWAYCNGQTLSINQNAALFSLLGTTYGGNGISTFQLPDLRGRVPLHFSNNFPLGMVGGGATSTLTQNTMPAHNHTLKAHGALATSASPTNAALGLKGRLGRDVFASPATTTQLASATISASGNGVPHDNMQPYLTIGFVIAMQGIYPSRG